MTGSVRPPLLFLDVDGPIVPFGGASEWYPTWATGPEPPAAETNPLLARIDPGHGPRLAALPCDVVWATTWMDDANACVSPRLGLSRLPVVIWPEPSDVDDQDEQDEQDERDGLHWKTRTLVAWAAGRSFAWADDEITDTDRAWIAAHHRAPALFLRVNPRLGLTDGDYAALDTWLRRPSPIF
ncbi:hypothetical protein [Streptomyces tailanensis]|uniref:hypothetical protein n=1 Tax=Streptomyces tailanensis TaxID=2569858 RepID=UPI00122E5490|nr:hypothetical protein [Streptomyces tailanensis]